MTSFYSEDEVKQLGLKHVGKDVLISRKTSIYGAGNIEIGDHVRIDDFCILSGKIKLHNYIHIAAAVLLFGGTSSIELDDYSSISSRTAVYADSDDYSGSAMTNPTIPDECRNVYGGKIYLGKHVIIGTGSTILPDVTIGEGCSVGSMALVTSSLEPWGIYVGVPCRKIKDRKKDLLQFEEKLK